MPVAGAGSSFSLSCKDFLYQREFTVLQLNSTVKEVLYSGFPDEFWIRGVVTGLRRMSSRGHTYFQLADPSPSGAQPPAVVDCALFAGDKAVIALEAGRLGDVFDLQNNTEVRIRATVNFWERSGRFQIVMKGFDHSFSGDSAAIHLKKLVEQLSAEGILQENGTLPFPRLPLTVGLVTSKGSAAERDFIKTLEESKYPFRVFARYATMQGLETADSVCSALACILSSRFSQEIDVVVLTRGGGSQTDLAWFNDERIARTIAQLPWPIVSAIGHEIDFTLPDHAAHTRAKTPTHAASILVDSVAAVDESISSMGRGLVSAFSPRIRMERFKLQSISRELSSTLKSLPEKRMAALRRIASEIALAAGNRLHVSERNLSSLEAEVDKRNPDKMLSLGWAIVRNQSGKLLRTAHDSKKGDRLSVSMQGGTLKVLVEERE